MRRCTINGKQAIFHHWTKKESIPDVIFAIVELDDGVVKIVSPNTIKFTTGVDMNRFYPKGFIPNQTSELMSPDFTPTSGKELSRNFDTWSQITFVDTMKKMNERGTLSRQSSELDSFIKLNMDETIDSAFGLNRKTERDLKNMEESNENISSEDNKIDLEKLVRSTDFDDLFEAIHNPIVMEKLIKELMEGKNDNGTNKSR